MKEHDDKTTSGEEEEVIADVELEDVHEDGEVDARATVRKLRASIKKLEQEKKDYLLGWQRAQADYANLRKETEANKKDLVLFANKRLLMELLPILDAYDMAQANKDAWNKVDQSWRVGIEYIFSQFLQVLDKNSVVAYGKEGEKYDLTLHEGVESVETEDGAKVDTLAQVLQRGYRLGELVLRPARVKVYILGGKDKGEHN